VDDRARSSSSSDPGSAIEGFRQKIPFHHKLTNLGMQIRQFRGAVLLSRIALLVKDFGELLDRLSLPGGDLGGVQLVLGRQLRDGLLALGRLKRDLRLELSRKPSPRPPDGSSSESANPP
jgi:hypothetical protein